MDIYNPLTIRKRCWAYMDGASKFTQVPDGIRGVCVGKLNDALAIRTTVKGKQVLDQARTDENRYIVLGFLFTPEDEPIGLRATSTFIDPEWIAFSKWVSPEKIENSWQARAAFVVEAQWVLNVARLVMSWTDHYIQKDKIAHPVGSFFPALADRLREKVQAESLIDAEPTAITLGGVPVQEGHDFYTPDQPAEPVVAQPWPGRKRSEQPVPVPNSDTPLEEVCNFGTGETFATPVIQQQELEKAIAWLMLNGTAIGQQAVKGDEICKQIVGCYRMLQSSPGDPGALGILRGFIDDYKKAHGE